MTLENCKMLLAHYQKCMDDNTLSAQARLNAKNAAKDMKLNIEAKEKALGLTTTKSKK